IERTVSLVDSQAERGRLRVEQAMVLLLTPAGTEQATAILREVIEEDPGQTDAAMLLSGVLEKAERFDELAQLLSGQLNGAKDSNDPASVVSISQRLAGLLEQRGRSAEALDIYRAALEWEKESLPVLRAVVRIESEGGDSVAVADAIECLLSVERGEQTAEL